MCGMTVSLIGQTTYVLKLKEQLKRNKATFDLFFRFKVIYRIMEDLLHLFENTLTENVFSLTPTLTLTLTLKHNSVFGLTK